MTYIVGLQHNGRVYIGGDSAGVAGYSLSGRVMAALEAAEYHSAGVSGPFVIGVA